MQFTTLKEIVQQLERCGYVCEGGKLERNSAFVALKNMAAAEDRQLPTPSNKESMNWDLIPSRIQDIILEVSEELDKACLKHPLWPADRIHQVAIIVEEAGELMRAALIDRYEEEQLMEMRKEAIQTAAMAIRFLIHTQARPMVLRGTLEPHHVKELERICDEELDPDAESDTREGISKQDRDMDEDI